MISQSGSSAGSDLVTWLERLTNEIEQYSKSFQQLEQKLEGLVKLTEDIDFLVNKAAALLDNEARQDVVRRLDGACERIKEIVEKLRGLELQTFDQHISEELKSILSDIEKLGEELDELYMELKNPVLWSLVSLYSELGINKDKVLDPLSKADKELLERIMSRANLLRSDCGTEGIRSSGSVIGALTKDERLDVRDLLNILNASGELCKLMSSLNASSITAPCYGLVKTMLTNLTRFRELYELSAEKMSEAAKGACQALDRIARNLGVSVADIVGWLANAASKDAPLILAEVMSKLEGIREASSTLKRLIEEEERLRGLEELTEGYLRSVERSPLRVAQSFAIRYLDIIKGLRGCYSKLRSIGIQELATCIYEKGGLCFECLHGKGTVDDLLYNRAQDLLEATRTVIKNVSVLAGSPLCRDQEFAKGIGDRAGKLEARFLKGQKNLASDYLVVLREVAQLLDGVFSCIRAGVGGSIDVTDFDREVVAALVSTLKYSGYRVKLITEQPNA